jgi:hypothetical protein
MLKALTRTLFVIAALLAIPFVIAWALAQASSEKR